MYGGPGYFLYFELNGVKDTVNIIDNSLKSIKIQKK